jgi:Cu(I)/Ag(I) efflux system membrane fusion protein
MSGIVIEKNGVEGAYVKTGTNIYTIADLTRVWVVLDAYESDLPWLAFGQKVSFTTEGIPGKTFEGQVAFIDPFVDPQTRTVHVRLNVINTKGELKPGMFVHGTVHATIGPGGKAINPELAEKWVCPMHPEIVEEKPGSCAVCEMPLVTSESLGIVHAPDHHYESLLIPASAVLRTGSRAIVYVRLSNSDPTFEGREIILGPRVGDHYIVKSGLEAGEKVVVNGNFKIDSAMQIAAKQSMMNPRINKYKVGKKDKLKVTDEVMEFMEKVLVHYYAIQQSLAGDNLSDTQSSVKGLNQLLQSFQNGHVQLVHEAAFQWKKVYTQMQETTTHHQHWNSIDEVRMAFKNLSQAFLNYENLFGHFSESTAYEVFCPLAFDNSGASWLSQKNEVLNPYFGASMLKCGEVKREFQVTGN